MRTTIGSLLATMMIVSGCQGGIVPVAESGNGSVSEATVAASRVHATPMRNAALPQTTPKGNLLYSGGPLLARAKVVPLFWSSQVQLQSQLKSFYAAIVNSPYFDWLGEYSINGYTIGRGTTGTAVVDRGAPTGTVITDAQVQTELARLIDAGSLPKPDANTVIATHLPSGVNVTLPGGEESCVLFCSYHSAFSHNGQNVYYTVIPDQTNSGCSTGCGYAGATTTNITTELSSHELIQAVTDPAVTLNEVGWYDQTNGEIADICDSQVGTIDGWVVRLGWSDKYGACIDQAPAACVPNCSGRACGSDGCGGSCGTCGSGSTCNAGGQCSCVPNCGGRTCGSNGCGGSCGTCPSPYACGGSQCYCPAPTCGSGVCGTITNACGASTTCSNTCAAGSICSNNRCTKITCVSEGCVGTYPNCKCFR